MTSNHLKTFTKIRKFLSQELAKRLSKVYIMSTFKYCPLKLCGKTENNSINKIDKHTLVLIYEMEDANFDS